MGIRGIEPPDDPVEPPTLELPPELVPPELGAVDPGEPDPDEPELPPLVEPLPSSHWATPP